MPRRGLTACVNDLAQVTGLDIANAGKFVDGPFEFRGYLICACRRALRCRQIAFDEQTVFGQDARVLAPALGRKRAPSEREEATVLDGARELI